MGDAASLTPRQAKFVEEYLVDRNGTQAAIRAGYSAKTAQEQSSRLLSNVIIAETIARRIERLSQKVEFTALDVLKRWIDIATADASQLVQHRRAPCRHCNGINHLYQWKTEREFLEASDKATREAAPEPSNAGGYGYRTTAAINPDCPECSGEGIGYTLAADTRELTGQAKLLYAGTKQTKDGLEIKLHDQGKALENVARHLGMFVEQKQLLGSDGKPIDPAKAVIVFQVQK